MQKDNYTLLIEKLDEFTRKYYVNQLLRGSLYTVGTVLGLFIALNVLEYYFYFGTLVRTAMFWGFLAISGVALYQWVALPLMHYFRLGRLISHEQAAQIIGNHFANVKDKLLNILQLKNQSNNAIYAELIHASINQKSEEIKLVPFKSAIDLGSNRKYLRYALPPILLLLFLLLGAPNILREGSKRLWNSTTTFEKPAPFRFLIDPESLHVVQFGDYDLKVKVDGAALPNEMFIDLGKVQYRLTKEAANLFSYRFTNVQRDTEFKLYASGVESRDYTLNVVKKPNMLSFGVKLVFPAYIGRAPESMDNVGDLILPQGTQINWSFNAQNTDALELRFGAGATETARRIDDELFGFGRRAMQDERYTVFLSNANLPKGDSVAYSISIIPDLRPQINVQEFRDSTLLRTLFFAGDASDDYGLLNLSFNYQIKKAKGGQMPLQTQKLAKPEGKQVQYSHTWDIRNLELEPGDEVSYYFEVFDNDGVNGSKSTRTGVMTWRMPSTEEVRQQVAQNNEEIKQNLENALKESRKIEEELRKLREKTLQKKELDWQTRKEMERLLQRQKQLQQQMDQAQQAFEENKQQMKEFSQQNEELMKKEEQLEKLFDETMSQEMKQLMEEIEKLMQELNKDQMLEQMEQMQMSSEELSKELDRLQELYKKLEVENLLQDQIERLEELAKDQEELAKETEDGNKSPEDLQAEQDALNKKMEEVKDKQEELLEKNAELKRPKEIEDAKEEMQDIQNEQKGSQKDLQSGDKKSSGKKKRSAAGKMKDMANNMRQKAQSGDKEQQEEDMAAIRQLLENIIGLSFSQEQVMKEIRNTSINTPRYVELAQQQYRIKDDFRIVEDSLQALATRNFQIAGTINDKVAEVKGAINFALEQLEERQTDPAMNYQQVSMKALNDLALLLADALAQAQMDMANMMPGNQSCQKPGKSGKGKDGREPLDKVTKGQQGLGQQMQDLKNRLEQQGGKDKNGMSKEFAQMAARQAALRNQLRELQKQRQEQGKGSKALDEIMQQMDQIETDLVNKRLTNEMIQRQQEIMTRLLEEERAEREQEQDEQRQAQTAQQQAAPRPPALEEYLRKRQAEIDQYRTVSPALRPFYKGLVEDYLREGQ